MRNAILGNDLKRHARAGVDIDAINYATKYTTKRKQNFPTVTKSSLMNPYLNQEHQNSSISLTTSWQRLPAEKLAVICRQLYWNPIVNMYLQMA